MIGHYSVGLDFGCRCHGARARNLRSQMARQRGLKISARETVILTMLLFAPPSSVVKETLVSFYTPGVAKKPPWIAVY